MQIYLESQRRRQSHVRNSQAFKAVGPSVVLGNRKVTRQPGQVTRFHYESIPPARSERALRPPSVRALRGRGTHRPLARGVAERLRPAHGVRWPFETDTVREMLCYAAYCCY